MPKYKQIYEQGLNAQEQSDFNAALDCYYKIAAEDEVFPALYNNMALCLKAAGQGRQALAIMAKASRVLPDQPEILLNYARLLAEAQKWDALAEILAPLLDVKKPDSEALFLMGKYYFENKNFAKAYEYTCQSYEQNPEVLHTIILLTACLFELDRETEAGTFVDELLSREIAEKPLQIMVMGLLNSIQRPNDALAYYEACKFAGTHNPAAEFQLGLALKNTGEYEKSQAVFKGMLTVDPKSAEAYRGLGELMMAENMMAEAETYFQQALEIKPEFAEVINNYGVVLRHLDRLEEAEKLHLEAIAHDPTRPEPYVNLASLMNFDRRYQESVAANMKALELRPSYLPGMSNLIGTLREMGESEQALEWLDKFLEKEPTSIAGLTNKAFLNLTLGNIDIGWEAYEIRKKLPQQYPVLAEDLPEGVAFWEGQDLSGKRVFISSEQGIGDELMFASCFHEIIDRAAFTLIECEHRLIPLFSRSFPKAVFIPRKSRMNAKGEKVGHCMKGLIPHLPLDYVIAAGSLPRFFRKSAADFPKRESYLVPDPALVDTWGARFSEFSNVKKIGLCWRSGNQAYHRRKYYLSLEKLQPIFRVPVVQIFNLQYGDCTSELSEAKEKWNLDVTCFDGLNLKDDFDQVAALMMHLDVIVSAATSMGELAGALGKRVIRFEGGPDWTRLGQPERPWYAHMTSLRRIGEMGWEPLVEQAAETIFTSPLEGEVDESVAKQRVRGK